MSRVLVTGAAGKVARALLPRLATDTEIVATDVAEPDPPYTQPNISFTKASVTDPDVLRQHMNGCTHVIHMALGDPSDWQSVMAIDLDGTRNVLGAAADTGTVRRVILASSNHAVGMYEKRVLSGDEPPRPNDPALLMAIRPDS